MKYIVFLFNFYMTVLILMPCQDAVAISSALNSRDSVQQNMEDSERCSEEICTPFCSCTCCTAGKDFPLKTVSAPGVPFVCVSYSSLPTTALTEQPVAIWQPPKLV